MNVITVTSPAEAALAAEAGAARSACRATGTRTGTFVNDDAPGATGACSLIGEVAAVTGLPQIARAAS